MTPLLIYVPSKKHIYVDILEMLNIGHGAIHTCPLPCPCIFLTEGALSTQTRIFGCRICNSTHTLNEVVHSLANLLACFAPMRLPHLSP